MLLFLDVPYKEKDDAKSKGAKFDFNKKRWYVDNIVNISSVKKWIPKHTVLCSNLYIFEMEHVCWNCKKNNLVICLATNLSYSPDDQYEENKDLQLLSYVMELPVLLGDYLKINYQYYPSFSKQIKTTYHVNHCHQCGQIQGDNFLHELPIQAFYKKLCYENSNQASYTLVENDFIVPVFATLPYYDEESRSPEMWNHHMQTGIENRASLHVTQKLINGLFSKSIFKTNIKIPGI